MKKALKHKTGIILSAALVATAVFVQGCAVTSVEHLKISRYRPQVDAAKVRPALPVSPVATSVVANANSTNAVSGITNTVRFLRNGDRVFITLKGIHPQEEIKDVIDEQGGVNLPLVGVVKITDMTTTDAEALIQKLYIQGEIYKKIFVSIVAQEEEYYVGGEVNRPGRFPVTPDMTLLRAITAAGGFTDYADQSEVKVIRGKSNFIVNCKKIKDKKEKDPLLEAGDVIDVPKSIFPL